MSLSYLNEDTPSLRSTPPTPYLPSLLLCSNTEDTLPRDPPLRILTSILCSSVQTTQLPLHTISEAGDSTEESPHRRASPLSVPVIRRLTARPQLQHQPSFTKPTAVETLSTAGRGHQLPHWPRSGALPTQSVPYATATGSLVGNSGPNADVYADQVLYPAYTRPSASQHHSTGSLRATAPVPSALPTTHTAAGSLPSNPICTDAQEPSFEVRRAAANVVPRHQVTMATSHPVTVSIPPLPALASTGLSSSSGSIVLSPFPSDPNTSGQTGSY